MSAMKEILFRNWHLMRIIRLLMGIAIIIMAIQQHQIMLTIVGGWFSLLAILNTGCSAQGCDYRPPVRRTFNEPPAFDETESHKKL